jgi:hypothetical protein
MAHPWLPRNLLETMSLSTHSMTEAAKKRTHRARVNVEIAETQLKSANETLEKAIPAGDTEMIQSAHDDTLQAEDAIARANEDLQVVETLLEADTSDAQAGHPSTGEGLKSLLKLLHIHRP